MPASSTSSHMRYSVGNQWMRHSKLLGMLLLFSAVFSACTTVAPPPTPPVVPPTPPLVPPLVPPVVPPPVPPPIAPAAPTLQPADWSTLDGWQDDNLTQAWPALLNSCRALSARVEWAEVCELAQKLPADNAALLRQFFESRFTPYRVVNPDGSETGIVTGYYEPLLRGSRSKQGAYQYPLYAVPDDLITVDLASLYPELANLRLRGRVIKTEQGVNKLVPYFSRAEFDGSNAPPDKVLVWVDDAIEAFFLEIQGSGRIKLNSGDGEKIIRVNYANQNGHPYKSIGRWLIDQGEMKLENASMQGIKNWVKSHPKRLAELLSQNPSYVFFRELPLTDPNEGPLGALGVPLIPERSIAIDPRFIPLGAPVFLSTTQPNNPTPLKRLMHAQDTGGAIRGAVRADFFWGFGNAAGEQAGKMRQQGRMWVLLPKGMVVNAEGKVARK